MSKVVADGATGAGLVFNNILFDNVKEIDFLVVEKLLRLIYINEDIVYISLNSLDSITFNVLDDRNFNVTVSS